MCGARAAAILREPVALESVTEGVARGREALARGAWAEARRAFEAALVDEETPEALEGLGLAAWWLDDATVTFPVRESAYRLYVERGEAAMPLILRLLDGAGLSLRELSLSRPSLDDVFLRQTGRSLRDEEAAA